MRSIVFLAICLGSQTLFAQVTVTNERILSGVSNVRDIGGKLFIGDASELSVEPVGLIDLGKIPDKPQVLKVIVTNAKREPVSTEKITPTQWIVRGTGKIWIDVRILDLPSAFIVDEQIEHELAGTPTPEPDPPPPDPDPVPDVLDDYHVGLVALKEAPNDPQLAKQIAGLYTFGAGQLFGRPTLKDIDGILTEIRTKFSARQCRDKETCDHWARWKVAVDAALLAEQKRRGTFSREDWYRVLFEIANALEQVK